MLSPYKNPASSPKAKPSPDILKSVKLPPVTMRIHPNRFKIRAKFLWLRSFSLKNIIAITAVQTGAKYIRILDMATPTKVMLVSKANLKIPLVKTPSRILNNKPFLKFLALLNLWLLINISIRPERLKSGQQMLS